MKCDKCKWAEWARTKNGRLHPDKSGKCSYEIVIPELPSAKCWPGFHDRPPEPSWGFIERGRELNKDCIYYEETK